MANYQDGSTGKLPLLSQPTDLGNTPTYTPSTKSSLTSSGGGGATVSTPSGQSKQFMDLLDEVYENSFAIDPMGYQQLSGQELGDQVSAWLRPSYDQAIYNRGLSTSRANAELDADALARGMGASSYVSDVKSRNFRNEAQDVALLESEYGATLAKNVSELLDKEKSRALEISMFNRQQDQANYQMAFDATNMLFGRGVTASNSTSGTRREREAAATAPLATSTAQASASTSQTNCASFLSWLSPTERARIYTGTDAQSQAYRNEIIASVGLAGFYKLQKQYGIS